MRLFGLFRRNQRWERQVDAHLDGRLTPVERALLGERVDESAEVRRTYEDSLALKRSLRAMPVHPVPRSFAITEAMLEAGQPVHAHHVRGARVTMRLSQATAFAAVAAFGILLGFDLSGDGEGSTSSADELAGLSAMTAENDANATSTGDAGAQAPASEAAPAGTPVEDVARNASPGDTSLQQDGQDGDATAIALLADEPSAARDYLPVYLALGGVLVLAAGSWAICSRQLARVASRP